MKILLAVDGSEGSTRAARQVVTFVRALRKQPAVIVLNADPALMSSVAIRLGAEETARQHAQSSEAALKPARAVLRRARIDFSEERRIGDAGPAIAAFAAKSKCDLIVMGSHGRTGLANLVKGSVTMKVIGLGSVPVLVVR